jgi:hypothetical protein
MMFLIRLRKLNTDCCVLSSDMGGLHLIDLVSYRMSGAIKTNVAAIEECATQGIFVLHRVKALS